MPRQPRIDYSGYLYHVMARGIERRRIFIDDADYEDYLGRLEKCLKRTDRRCLAFSLLPNHLLILRGVRKSMGLVLPLVSRREEDMQMYDERILGDGDFVESVLRRREKEPQEKKVSLDEVMGVVREKTGVGEKEIRSRSQVRKVVKARALYCYLAREKSGLSGAELMKQLRMTSGAISSLVSRGKGFFESVSLRL